MHIGRVHGLNKTVCITMLLVSSVFFSGCAVFMAAKQPPKKDLRVLEKGTSRSMVLAELGAPVTTDEKDGKKVDIFSFRQGYTTGVKTSRAVFHGLADIASLGLWEVVGTPTEIIASGKDIKVEVVYDQNEKVDQVNYLYLKKDENKK